VDISTLFLERHDNLREWIRPVADAPDAQRRARPHGVNPITWPVWHPARVEDSGLKRLVFDRPLRQPDTLARSVESGALCVGS
jgi:hypothetical protein